MNLRKIIIFSMIIFAAGAAASFAQAKYSIKQMTPAVESALESRRNRFDQLSGFKAQGVIGENNQGYVEFLGGDESAKAVVEAENKDRRVIYQTIAEQNDLKDAIATIEKVFAQVQRDKAQAGEKVQSEDGQWGSK